MILKAEQLCAAWEQTLIAGAAEGKIHSVFDRAVNLMTAGDIKSVLPAEKGLYPMSCTVQTGAPFTGMGLHPNMRASVSRAGIQVPEADFEVDFGGAEVRSLDTWEKVSGNVPARLGLPALKALLCEQGNGESMLPLALARADTPYSAMIRPRLPALHEAFLALDPSAAALAAQAIAGCGIGLTPSSDDMLLGYVCAYYPLARAKGLDREETLFMGRSALYAAAEKTNDISGAFLRQCGDGLASQAILDLLHALFSGAPEQRLHASALRILHIGAASGADILTGIVLSLQTHGGG
ncbi:MAG TPA: DUF2877 domain-containing protein [Clostridia bacterium]|nr:DUF2877 domain-containing protein [Clostridia bacterium]